MTETLDTTTVVEALTVIDEGLARFAARELVSSSEVSDLLLDLRTVLVTAAPPAEPTVAEPVGA